MKQEEVNMVVAQKTEIENHFKKLTEEYEDFKNKSGESNTNSPNTNIIKERDTLKDKNEKLTNMCKKYLAKLKQLETKSNKTKTENDSEKAIEELTNKVVEL